MLLKIYNFISTENDTIHKETVKKIFISPNADSKSVRVPFAVSDIKLLSDASPSGNTIAATRKATDIKLIISKSFIEGLLTLFNCREMFTIHINEITNNVSQNKFPVYNKS